MNTDIKIGTRLSLLILLCIPGTTGAQDISSPYQQIDSCDRANASRLPPDSGCGFSPEPIVIRNELESSVTLTMPTLESRRCEATVSIGYLQKNTVAAVEGTLDHDDCAASSGSYVVLVRVRDGQGVLNTQEFQQSWQRDDDQPVSFSDEYPIGENVDLVRVRAQRVRCLCDPPAGN